MPYTLNVTTAPAVEPVTLKDALAFLGLPNSATTTTSADAAAAATSITVASAAGLSVGDTIAVGNETTIITAITGLTLTVEALPNAVPSGSIVSAGSDHELVAQLITAARQQVEAYLGRALITQTLQLLTPGFYDPTIPSHPANIRLPRPPLQTVTSVKYIDWSDTLQTVATTTYGVDALSEPGMVYLKMNELWPIDWRLNDPQVQIAYTAGYGANRSDVPAGIRAALKQVVAGAYDAASGNVQSEKVGQVQVTYSQTPMPSPLLAPFKIWAW